MKYQILIFASIFISTINIGCSKQTKSIPKPQEVIITGQVINKHNYDPKTIAIIINDVATGEQIRFLDDLDDKGNFQIKFERYYPQEVMLKYFAIWSVFVHPGDSIHLDLDAKKMESNETIHNTLAFSGDAATENQQLSIFNAWYIPLRSEDSQMRFAKSGYKPETYKQYRDSLRNEYHKEANKIIETYKISEPIRTWIYYEIEHYYYHSLIFYPEVYRRLNKCNENWEVPESYYNFFEDAIISPDFILNAHFADSFIKEYFNHYVINNIKTELIQQGLLKDTILQDGSKRQRWMIQDPDSVIIDGINKYSANKLKQYLLNTYIVSTQKHDANTETYEKFLTLIRKEITQPFLLANLQKNYLKNKEIEKSPQSKNIFDSKNYFGTEILKKIISENKDKVIYIDCWSTWCGACIEEMPNSKLLMDELKNENVEFVYLCCNSPIGAGKRKVEDLRLGGTHYFLDNDQTNYIQKELSFSSYPNYVLIDKKGNIVESSSRNRPSNSETKEKILNLINE